MCGFCKYDPDNIPMILEQRINFGPLGSADIGAYIGSTNDSEDMNCITVFFTTDECGITATSPIKYCPLCGRSLR